MLVPRRQPRSSVSGVVAPVAQVRTRSVVTPVARVRPGVLAPIARMRSGAVAPVAQARPAGEGRGLEARVRPASSRDSLAFSLLCRLLLLEQSCARGFGESNCFNLDQIED